MSSITNQNNVGFATGRLCREVTQFQYDGGRCLSFTLAVRRRFGGGKDQKPESDFIPMKAFVSDNGSGYSPLLFAHTGDKLSVMYHIQTATYTDKAGEKQYSVSMIVDSVEFQESREVRESRRKAAE